MAAPQNPFTNPQLLHPDLAGQISDVEDWQQAHDLADAVGAVGVVAAVQNAVKEHRNRNSFDEAGPEFSHALFSARDNLVALVAATRIQTVYDVPELTDPVFENTDWGRLDASFREYELFDLQPVVVITPTGRDQSYWRTLYGGLCEWQTHNPPSDEAHRLELSSSGLYIHADVESQWDKFIPPNPGWQISVVAGTPNPPVMNINAKGQDRNGRMPRQLEDMPKETAQPGAASDVPITLPSVEDYLILQAIRLYQDAPPVDNNQTMTWLDGEFAPWGGDSSYPCGTLWKADNGVGAWVVIEWDKLTHIDTKSGIRPITRG